MVTACIFAGLSTFFILESKFDMRDATEKKWLTAAKIKDFVDTLQKKTTQDIQAVPQNK